MSIKDAMISPPMERVRRIEPAESFFRARQAPGVTIDDINQMINQSKGLEMLYALEKTMNEMGYNQVIVRPCPLLTHSFLLVWDYDLPLNRGYDLASAIYLCAVPNRREIIVIGQEAEVLEEKQWGETLILADALVQTQKNPRSFFIPQYPKTTLIDP